MEKIEDLVGDSGPETITLTFAERAAVQAHLMRPAVDGAVAGVAQRLLDYPDSETRGRLAYALLRYELLPALRGMALAVGRPMDAVARARAKTAVDDLVKKCETVLVGR